MISIIVSSYQKHYYEQFVKSVQDTIGIEQYEIIQIWNPGIMSITQAYNQGASKSTFENLLFIHEDIIFHTQNWGKKLIMHLEDPKTGVLGIAGSDYVPSAPCSWTVVSRINRNYLNLYQNDNTKSSQKLISNIRKKHLAFAVDGVFIAIKKEKFDTLKFDEDISGFHGYDQDFSLRSGKKYVNYVISDILIEHFSKGSPDSKWFFSNMSIRKKLGSRFQPKNVSKIEMEAYIDFLKHFFNNHKKTIGNIVKAYRFYPFFKMDILDHLRVTKRLFLHLSGKIQEEKK